MSPKWNAQDPTSSNNFATWGGWGDDYYHYTYSSSMFKLCNKDASLYGYVFGGPDLFGKNPKVHKIFINMPTHTKVEVSLNIYFIDSWNDEYFYLDVDSARILTIKRSNFQVSGINYCGANFYDEIEQYYQGSTDHSDPSMTLYFYSNLDQDLNEESFAFKDLRVFLYNDCHYSCVTCSAVNSDISCLTCPSFATLIAGKCICRDKWFMSATPYTLCEECDVSCATCSGSGSSSCGSCYNGFNLTSGSCIKPTCFTLIFDQFKILFFL